MKRWDPARKNYSCPFHRQNLRLIRGLRSPPGSPHRASSNRSRQSAAGCPEEDSLGMTRSCGRRLITRDELAFELGGGFAGFSYVAAKGDSRFSFFGEPRLE